MKGSVAVFKIFRFNPEREKKPHYDTFRVEIKRQMSILDALEYIKHEKDASLTFRRSCRSGICGSCAMKINRHSKLACKTLATVEGAKHGGEVLIEPMENMPVIRDLVVDMKAFWQEIKRGRPWLETDENNEKNFQENVLTKEQLAKPTKLADCIMCGACFSDCISRSFDENFTGPASLAKVYRFVTDPRDKAGLERVDGLTALGLWSCTHCFFCVSQCPKDVRPLDAISALRVLSVSRGGITVGARHAKAVKDVIKGTGALNEALLYLKTRRLNTLRDIPLIFSMAIKGRAPSPFKKPIPKIDEVRLIYRLVGIEE